MLRPVLRNVQLIIPHYEVITLEFPGGSRKIAVFARKSENCMIPPEIDDPNKKYQVDVAKYPINGDGAPYLTQSENK